MQITAPKLADPAPPPPIPDRAATLMAKARALEAAFLTEMLGHAGLSSGSEAFGGGIGEDQFASFLREEQAKLLVATGGIGLAEQLFHAMTQREANHDT